MKFLIFDHFFGQDIEALRHVVDKHEFRVVSALLLSRIAHKYFPASVFTSLLGEAYAFPEYADARRRYAIKARKFLHSLYYTFPFDAVIVPSDTIFYFRALLTASHEMGIPFIVLQKETAISPYTMNEDARVIGEALPFIGDLMVVCSENHKQFWLNTGADSQKIIVTGQPRFDFYHYPERWKTLHSYGVHFLQNRPIVLFFSYDVGAYSPDGVLTPTWAQLRDETEEALINAAKQGYINLLIKPHPQQQGIMESQERLRKMAGNMWGETVQWLSGTFDTRHLIVNAQIVVGFQTTALLEAMTAGKIVIYTFWTEAIIRFVKAILPFHEMENALLVARSAKELEDYLRSDREISFTDAQKQKRRYEAERQMGPLDGQAAIRSLNAIIAFTEDYVQRADPKTIAFRHSLDAMAPAYCRRSLIRARAGVAIWRIAEWLLPIAYRIWRFVRRLQNKTNDLAFAYERYHERIASQRQAAREALAYINARATSIVVYNDFDAHDSGGWAIYEWIPLAGGGADHILHPVSLENRGGVGDSGYAWGDDSRWTIDVPDSNSILPLLFYNVYKPLRRGDLRNAVVSVYLRGKALDLKGGQVYFWVYNFKTCTRYHYIAHPLTIAQDNWGTRQTVLLDTNPTHWFHSWTSTSHVKGELEEVLRDVNSYGFSFLGCSSKATGRLEMDQFSIIRATSLDLGECHEIKITED